MISLPLTMPSSHLISSNRATLAIILLLGLFNVGLAADSRPNILFIMSDDHGAQAIGAYGSRVNQTPHLDRLARSGVLFRNAFVCNSVCTPSRASILTGQYSHLNGVPVFNRFDGSRCNVAKILQAGGYATAMIGKWHLGSEPTGFQHWVILPGQGVYFDPGFLTPHGRLQIKGYVTDVITDLGIEYLERRPKDRPFFLMLHHKAPHANWDPDPKHQQQFQARPIPEPPTLFDTYATRTAALPENQQRIGYNVTRGELKLEPPSGLSGPQRERWLDEMPNQSVAVRLADGTTRDLAGAELVRWKYQRFMQDYLACVQSIDDNLGRLLDYLDRTGLATNTVVFYTSDNGFFLGEMGLFDKRFMYEPSLRVPLIVRWPGATVPGTETDRFALNVDFAPTFLDLAGLSPSADMQGRSLVAILRGTPPSDWRTAMYYRYYHDPGDHNTRAHYGLRTTNHKLIHFWKSDQWEMFDLLADPLEQTNLVAHPDQKAKFAELQTQLARLKTDLRDYGQFSEGVPSDSSYGPFTQRGDLGWLTVAEAVMRAREPAQQ